jgi:hypothetical protein
MRIGFAVALLAALSAGTSLARPPAPVVPPGQLLVSDRNGQLLVVDATGRVRRRLPFTRRGCCQVELAADRRHAFVSLRRGERFTLLEVDLTSGRAVRIAAGGSPALSPDGRRLAYYAVSIDNDVASRTAVVIRDLATGRSHAIPFAERAAWGTPPDVLINWSPDGRSLAAVGFNRRDGSLLHIVDVAHARTIESQPSLGHVLAPVFLDDRTVLVLANCCTGTHQQMVAVTIASGARKPFATLPEPPESLRRIAPGTFVATTPDGFLLRFSKGRATRLGAGRYFSVSG